MPDVPITPPDAQDPLPESNWLWRRVFVFGLTIGLLILVYLKIDSVADVARMGSKEAIEGLVKLLRICLWLIGGLVLFYMLAPSAEQLVKLIQTAKSLRDGVRFTSSSTATAGTATTVSTAGQPPEPDRWSLAPPPAPPGSPPPPRPSRGGKEEIPPPPAAIPPAPPIMNLRENSAVRVPDKPPF